MQLTENSPYLEDVAHYRRYLEDLLINNQVKLLVATIALGMGFDKPDIGFVVHFQVCIQVEFLHITSMLYTTVLVTDPPLEIYRTFPLKYHRLVFKVNQTFLLS